MVKNRKIMKAKLLILNVCILLLCSCKESNLLEPFGANDKTPPSDVTSVKYSAIPGGAIINYVLPQDEDLSFVKAVYNVNGVERSAMSSQYNSEIKIEGLPDKKEYPITLYAVDKAGNKSPGVALTIVPEETTLKFMIESLNVKADFGGFKIDYENPSQAELTIYIYQKDSLSDNMVFYEARVFSQAKGTYQVVGLPNKTNKFKIFVRDRFENTSEPLEFEDRPWREEYLNKKKFKYVGKPYVVDNDDWYAWMGRPENLWDDIVGEWNFAQTAADGHYPHYLCIDLGTTVPIGRILFQQRLGDSNIFNLDCIKYFNVYGAAELPSVNKEDPFAGWIKLNDKTFEVIRPSGRKPGDPPTTEDQEAAEKGIMFTIDTPFPRPEIRYIRFEFLKSFTDRSMAILSELSFWAQWK
jgi:hypothetical protein